MFITARFVCLISSFILLQAGALAGDAAADWARVIALDAGPGGQPQSEEEAVNLSLAHLDRQEKALRAFLTIHAAHQQAFDARLRLARLLGIRADLRKQAVPAEAARLLDEAEKLAVSEPQRADLAFFRLSQRMREWQTKRPPQAERRELLEAVKKFQGAHPGDRRIPALLVEVATLFEGDVKTKEPLLREAGKLTEDEGLRARIADDQKRISFLGRPLPLRFTALDGVRHEAEDWRGKVVVVLFFATVSEPAKAAFIEMQRVVAGFENVVFVAISLDGQRLALQNFLKQQNASMPVQWDGKGWDGPLIKALGINAVPAAWLLDKQGVVRTLDALDAPEDLIRKLQRQ